MSTWSPLREKRFVTLWSTVELSFLGPFVHIVACGWLMTTLTSSPVMVSLIQTAYSAPLVVLSMLAGALADTLDRRATMLASLAISFAASLGLAAAAWGGALTPWSMLGLLFLVGAGVAVFTPSWQASIGDIVSRERLPQALSLHNMGANLMRTVGPALGGLMVAAVGAVATFLAGALAYLPGIAAVAVTLPRRRAADDRERLHAAVGFGLRYLAAAPSVRPLLWRVLAYCTATVSVVALLPLVAKDELGGDALAYGILFGGYGVGAISAGLCLDRLRRRYATETIVSAAALGNAAAVALLAVAGTFWTGFLATFLAGGCWLLTHTLLNSTLQLATPRWMVGRIVAMYLTAAYLGLSFGGWLWGAVAELSGTRGALGVSAAALVGVFLMARKMPLPDAAAPTPADEPFAPPDLHGHAGPVHILVDYRIAAAATPAFLRLMDERRRQIMRLGARRWALLRDAADPEAWTESFRTDSAADYERLLRRRSAENLGLRKRLWDLNGGPPTTRRLLETVREQAPPAS